MMNRLFLVLLLSMLLTACTQSPVKPENETIANDKDAKQKVQTKLSPEDFVISTLDSYNKTVTKSDFHVEKQSENKYFVLIKDLKTNAKPDITRFVFLEKDGNYEALFLMVDNNVVIDN